MMKAATKMRVAMMLGRVRVGVRAEGEILVIDGGEIKTETEEKVDVHSVKGVANPGTLTIMVTAMAPCQKSEEKMEGGGVDGGKSMSLMMSPVSLLPPWELQKEIAIARASGLDRGKLRRGGGLISWRKATERCLLLLREVAGVVLIRMKVTTPEGRKGIIVMLATTMVTMATMIWWMTMTVVLVREEEGQQWRSTGGGRGNGGGRVIGKRMIRRRAVRL